MIIIIERRIFFRYFHLKDKVNVSESISEFPTLYNIQKTPFLSHSLAQETRFHMKFLNVPKVSAVFQRLEKSNTMLFSFAFERLICYRIFDHEINLMFTIYYSSDIILTF